MSETKFADTYELTMLFKTELEPVLEQTLKKIRKTIEKYDGKILKEENDGKKRLAYSINGEEYAIYYYMELNLVNALDISRELNVNEDILRYLLVRQVVRG